MVKKSTTIAKRTREQALVEKSFRFCKAKACYRGCAKMSAACPPINQQRYIFNNLVELLELNTKRTMLLNLIPKLDRNNQLDEETKRALINALLAHLQLMEDVKGFLRELLKMKIPVILTKAEAAERRMKHDEHRRDEWVKQNAKLPGVDRPADERLCADEKRRAYTLAKRLHRGTNKN